MGAIGEGVAEAALRRTHDLRRAGRANRGVRRNLRMGFASLTFRDAELGRQSAAIGSGLDPIDPRQRRRLALDAGEQLLDRRGVAPDPHQHPLGVVERFAAEIKLVRHPPDRRAKTNALHPASDPNLHRLKLGRPSRLAGWTHGAASKARSLASLYPAEVKHGGLFCCRP